MRRITFRVQPQCLRVGQMARRGSIMVMSAVVMVAVMGFAAFTADVGYLALAKTQMQSAADSAALGAAAELYYGFGLGATQSVSQIVAAGDQAAISLAAAHRVADQPTALVNPTRDIRYGRYTRNLVTGQAEEAWGVAPYNAVEVTVRRDQPQPAGVSSPDGRLPLFFAPVLGIDQADLSVTAVAALLPGVGFRVHAGSSQCAMLLPFALDAPTWSALLNGTGTDQFTYNASSGNISAGADGIKEVNLYPYGNGSLPSGNRGTVDLGSDNNSTSDLARQILYGLNAVDLSYFGGEIRTDRGPLYLKGDTGISAGIKDELERIKGQPRAIPIFTAVSGPGNNATYTVTKFVGIRIMYVKLTGSPSSKQVIIQPAPFVDSTVIRGNAELQADSILTPARLLQ